MRLAVTGGAGLVGRFVVDEARAAGDEVTLLSRPGYRLGDAPDLEGCDALVHCAFEHIPGRYRGGEGDDPERFVAANLFGSAKLFEAARASGVARVIFLSSRAVYGDYPAGTTLTEDMTPRPDTLYGEVKWRAEEALEALTQPGFSGASLRATGVYGAGPGHKWTCLFKSFLSGHPVVPHAGTEVLGQDLAAAIRLLLGSEETGPFNASDILLDHHDLLSRVAALTGAQHGPPPVSDAPVSVMDCSRLNGLGWRPSGFAGLDQVLGDMVTARNTRRL